MIGISVRRNSDQPKFAELECIVHRLCNQFDSLTQSSAVLASWTLTKQPGAVLVDTLRRSRE